MLDRVFAAVLSMALSAGFVVCAVLLARLALQKAPKVFSYALWAVVLFRLLCPVSFESPWSLQRVKPNSVTPDIVYAAAPQIDSGLPALDGAVNASLPAATPETSANPMQTRMFVLEVVWLCGLAALLLYSLVTLLRVRRRLVGAVRDTGNVWLSDGVETPFVLGVFRPKIYLPSALPERERDYILLHERTHLRRGDNLVKLVFFLTLCVYWFDPLVWLAFFLCGRDMEMSCDEAVLRTLDGETRCDYSASLLRLSTGRRIVAGAPLAFGEGGVKGRIKNALNYRKPAFWAVWLSAAAVAALCFFLAANPGSEAARRDFYVNTPGGNDFLLRLPDCVFLPGPGATSGSGEYGSFYYNDGSARPGTDAELFTLVLLDSGQSARLPDTFCRLGNCGDLCVCALFNDGNVVSAKARPLYRQMRAALTDAAADVFFSSADGSLYVDRASGFYLRFPASWKGRYRTTQTAGCTSFYANAAPKSGESDENNLLLRVCTVQSTRFDSDPPSGDVRVLGKTTLDTVYLRYPDGRTTGASTDGAYRRMLADGKKLTAEDMAFLGGQNSSSLLKTTVSFTARTPTQKELDADIGTSGLSDPQPADFVLLHLSVTLNGRRWVDGSDLAVPDLINFPYDMKNGSADTASGARLWYASAAGSPADVNASDSNTAGCEYDVCLCRHGVSDADLRKTFAGQNITVRYRLKGSAEEQTETYPLDQLLTFQ